MGKSCTKSLWTQGLAARTGMEPWERMAASLSLIHIFIGTHGIYLSGGECQRIALARAILKDAPIVVLDEASAFADPENEYQIQKAFEKLIRNKTVLIIAHRLSTIRNADCILVMKDGKVAEKGTHQSLLDANGIYAQMWEEDVYKRQVLKGGKEH